MALAVLAIEATAQEFHSLWLVPKNTEIGVASPFGKGKIEPLEHGWQFTIPVSEVPQGSYIEWDMTITAKHDAPQYYALEYLDGGVWEVKDTIECTRTDDAKVKEFTAELSTLKLKNAIHNGNLVLRLHAITKGEGRPRFLNKDNSAASVRLLGTTAPKDTTRILCVGNSFTYVSQASWMLKEIAWNEGHYLDIQDALKGGQTFGQHLNLTVTEQKINDGSYEYVFLQNQSQTNAWFAQDKKKNGQILDDALELSARIRKHSASAKLIFESTWSYPGKNNGGFASLKEFDELLEKGTAIMARKAKGSVSPIGKAFRICRQQYPDIALLADDDKHQSQYGSYLKACVNYLIIFKKAFTGNPQDCSLDPQKTAKLREIAEKVVL